MSEKQGMLQRRGGCAQCVPESLTGVVFEVTLLLCSYNKVSLRDGDNRTVFAFELHLFGKLDQLFLHGLIISYFFIAVVGDERFYEIVAN